MDTSDHSTFAADCPTRSLLDEVVDKWSMMILTVLNDRAERFNAIKRRLEGITQKALTQCLRRLERNGLVTRRIIPVAPLGVEYAITPLGRSMHVPFKALYVWMRGHLADVELARQHYDSKATQPAME